MHEPSLSIQVFIKVLLVFLDIHQPPQLLLLFLQIQLPQRLVNALASPRLHLYAGQLEILLFLDRLEGLGSS